MSGWLADARFATRTLARHPRFSVAALLALALGIGANTAVYCVSDGWRARGHPPPSGATESAAPASDPWPLAAVTGGALLVACGSVGQLLLALDAARRRELALRGALGASRRRLLRQLLTESLLLALAGGGAGLLLAAWGIDLVQAFALPADPRLSQVRVNGRAALFTAALALATGYACGLLSAWRALPGRPGEELESGGSAAAAARPRRRRATRRWLAAGEVALGLWLLTGAGIQIKDLLLERAFDPGAPVRRMMHAARALKIVNAQPAAAWRDRELLEPIAFAGFVLALAAVGIYAATSWSVARRSREIAIRVAVGAGRRALLREVVREGLALACRGTLLGVGGFVLFKASVDRLCMPAPNDRSWFDPGILALAALLVLAVAALVSWLPASRAANLEARAERRE